MPTEDKIWRVAELCELWGCSDDFICNLLRTRQLQGFKIGRDWRISDEARLEFQRTGGTANLKKATPHTKLYKIKP